MSKKLKLVISKPKGFKGGMPIVGFPSRLVNMETGEEVPGLRDITLGIPCKGVLTCTAEILLGDIEVVEEIQPAYIQPLAGKAFAEIDQAEPGNGEDAPK